MDEDEVLESAKDRLRRQLKKILEDCGNSITDIEFGIESGPEIARELAADAYICQHMDRQWARKVLSDLDRDDPIPPLPA